MARAIKANDGPRIAALNAELCKLDDQIEEESKQIPCQEGVRTTVSNNDNAPTAPSQLPQSNLTAPSQSSQSNQTALGACAVPMREGKNRWLTPPSSPLSSSHMIMR